MRFVWLVFWCSTVGASAESKLDAVREEVLDDRASINQPASNPGADDRRHSSDLQHPDPLSDVTQLVIGWALISPWYIPMLALHDTRFDLGWPEAMPHQPPRPEPRALAVDVLIGGQADGDGVTHHWVHAAVDTRWRFGLCGSLDRLNEGDDHLLLGQSDVSWRFAQGSAVVFSTGGGVRWLADGVTTDVGVDLFYGVEVWPIAPLVLRAQLAGGRVGHAGVTEAWGHAGIAWRHGEIFAGGRWLKIGSVEFAGPVVGVGAHW